MIKHGMSNSRVYRIWIGMKGRCFNPKHPKFYKYGAKGITVCERWLDFKLFLLDMGEPPTDYSLDRRNGLLGYFKDNCRWATAREQAHNTTLNRMITFNGKTLPLKEWERQTGIPDNTIAYRLDRGWSVEQALTLPKHHRVNSHDGGWKTKRLHAQPNTE